MFFWVKRIFKWVAIFLLFVVVAVSSIATFVDLNNYKEEISQIVKKQTGRSCKIMGAIQWSLAPEISLYAENIEIGNANGFDGQFLFAREAHLKIDIKEISIKDLFFGKIAVNAFKGIGINGLKLYLTTTVAGKNNWDDLRSGKSIFKVSNGGDNSNKLKIDNVELRDVAIYYENKQDLRHIAIIDASVKAKGLDFNKYDTLPPLEIACKVRDLTENYKGTLSFSSNIILRDKQNIDFSKLSIKYITGRFNGSAKLMKLKSNPTLTADLQLHKLKPRRLLSGMEKKYDSKMQMPEKISGNVSITSTLNKVRVHDINLQVDSGVVKGEVEVVVNDRANSKAALRATDINLDNINNFLSTLMSPTEPLGIKNTDSNNIEPTKINLGKIPISRLTLDANNLSIDKYTINNISSVAKIHSNHVNVDPLDIVFLDGSFPLKLDLNFNEASPAVNLSTRENCTFSVESVLREFSINSSITGEGILSAKISTTTRDHLENLNGKFNFTINNGRYTGVDIVKILQHVENNLQSMTGFIKDQNFDPRSIIKSKMTDWHSNQNAASFTDFKFVRLSGNISNGITNNFRVAVQGPGYEISGGGIVNLVTRELNLTLNLKRKFAYSGEDKGKLGRSLMRRSLALKVGGTIDEPIVNPDMEHYMEQILKEVHQQIFKHALDTIIGTEKKDMPTDSIIDIFGFDR